MNEIQEMMTTNLLQQNQTHSIKIEETAKGCRVAVHVYADTVERARQEVLRLYLGVVHDLQSHDVKLAPMVATATTNGTSKE